MFKLSDRVRGWGGGRERRSVRTLRYATPSNSQSSCGASDSRVRESVGSCRDGRVSVVLSVSVSVVTLSSSVCCEGVCGGDGRGPMGLCVGALRAWWARRWTTSEPMEGRGKEAVHKCHSDPGGSARRVRAIGGRKCVLTLDGYSYVIGERVDSVINQQYSNTLIILQAQLSSPYGVSTNFKCLQKGSNIQDYAIVCAK